MKKIYFFLLSTSILCLKANAQSSFEAIASFGTTITPTIPYHNCTGNISSTFTPTFSFVYHPDPSVGFEINYSKFMPITYLNDPDDNSVAAYNSQISVERLLAGINFSLPFKKIRPYVGCLLGFTYAAMTEPYYPSTYTNFSWAGQAGVEYFFLPVVGLRLNVAFIKSPNISNYSSYFNVNTKRENFPTYAVGDPSSANIYQWNINLGIIAHFAVGKKKRK